MSSSPNPAPMFTLRADAKFRGASVSIFDGYYSIVKEGPESVEARVAPGLYIVQFKAGQLFEKQFVEVSGDTIAEPKTFSAPSAPSLKLPPWQPSESQQCRLYLRGEGDFGESFLKRITVLDSTRQNVPWPVEGAEWGIRHLGLSAGQYLLRVTVEDDKSLEQTVFIPSGYQAQIFFRPDADSRRESDACRWMTNAVILLYPVNFEYAAPDRDRQEMDAVLQNLSLGRPAMPVEAEAGVNPMLGIVMAHLLLRNRTTETAPFDNAVQELRAKIPLHPDVIALELRTDSPCHAMTPFALPPMLRNSWKIVVAQSAITPAIVPANSWSALAAVEMTGVQGWLVWRTPASNRIALEPTVTLEASLVQVHEQIKAMVAGKTDAELLRQVRDLHLNTIESALLTYLIGVIRTEDNAQKLIDGIYQSGFVAAVYRFFDSYVRNIKLVPKQTIMGAATQLIQKRSGQAFMIRSLEVPDATLRYALAGLAAKLPAVSAPQQT